jgi:predicted nucleic acid-binding protein
MSMFAGCVTIDRIASSSLIYIDTNIFIYFVEATPKFFEKAKAIFARVEAVEARVVTNEVTIAECIYKPALDSNLDLIRIYKKLFASKAEITLLPLDGALAKRAALNGSKLGLKLVDAIHYLSALEAGCEVFVTKDHRFKSGPKMRVVHL